MPFILHITSKPFSSTHGGLEVYLRQLTAAQQKSGDDVVCLSILWHGQKLETQKLPEDTEIFGVSVFEIHLPEKWKRWPEDSYSSELQCEIQNFLEKQKPDLVHLHHGFAALAAEVCQRLSIPCVYTVHCSEICCITGLLLKPDLSFCDGVLNEKKCLGCCGRLLSGGSMWSSLVRSMPNQLRRYAERKFAQWPFIHYLSPLFQQTMFLVEMPRHLAVLRKCDAVIAPSVAVRNLMLRQGGFGNLEVIPHGVKLFPPVKFPPVKNGIVHFYYAGRLCMEKGIHVMLESFRKVSALKYHLHIIGAPGSKYEARYVEKLKKTYDDMPITWYGKLSQDELFKKIAEFHVMIHPAFGFEIYGLSVAEAMASGHPVIATRCGGPEMQISDKINGWLVPRNDVKALSAVLTDITENPKSLATMSAKCSATTFEQHLSLLKTLYLKVWKKCEKKQTGPGAIYSMIFLGKKIVVHGKNYRWLRYLGLKVWSVKEFFENSREILNCGDEYLQYNRNRLLSYIYAEHRVPQWETICKKI